MSEDVANSKTEQAQVGEPKIPPYERCCFKAKTSLFCGVFPAKGHRRFTLSERHNSELRSASREATTERFCKSVRM